MNAKQFVALAKSGRDIRVRKGAGTTRTISIADLSGWRDLEVSQQEYEALMPEVIAELAARNGLDLKVEIRMDYLGTRWAEVRSGLLGVQVSRLRISPRYLQMLMEALAQPKARAPWRLRTLARLRAMVGAT